MMAKNTLVTITIALFLLSNVAIAQNQQETDTLNGDQKIMVFLDCWRCNDSYIQEEVQFVDFVRDKEDSDVHLIITRERSGSGTEYTLQVLGRGSFLGQDNTLTYFSYDSDTDDEERRGLVKFVRAALFQYVSTTSALNQIEISYTSSEESLDVQRNDPWRSWIFEINGRTSLDGEESRKSIEFSGGLSAERVTKLMKTEIEYEYDYNERTFSNIDSDGNNNESVFITRSHRFEGNQVFALTDHWSTGLFTNARNSTRNNYDLSIGAGAGIEYNIYPYEQYSEREISFVYIVGAEHRDYTETTIYLEDSETLYSQRLSSRVEFTQPWGSISGRANFQTFMHNFDRNRFEVNMRLNFRIFRGLDLSLSGRYSLINDQLNIPAGDISDAEQLLNLREQFTSYSYGAFIGLEYTFGSIFNQAVNPRF
ncbi:MAG: hypothetical protein HUJ22_06300 [Gracilimonas sp.]|uniref:hypothetical protein n=1 Tax=Gracilimonas sp. TaxID=1974203 RepID=UPI001994D5C2|nr:hypothetical protein [Gracilimonas sp.]MBD3616169.1 hypothetical protein [Gracilimonas sp.]